MNSMTGFGIARGKVGKAHFVVEARSVNHRYCEVSLRCPSRYALLEAELSRRIRQKFSRGKFDLFLKEESQNREEAEVVLARKSLEILRKIQKELKLGGQIQLGDVMRCRELLFNHHSHEDTESLMKPLLQLFEQAFQGLQHMRSREGAQLQVWFQKRIKGLEIKLGAIEKEAKKRRDQYRNRLESKWKGSTAIEEQRVMQESAIMAERADVTEEIVRLRSHLKEFEKMTQQNQSTGRKFDFLAQEMGREINTIGSKSQGVKISHLVIDFKSELEKIREQVQNIE